MVTMVALQVVLFQLVYRRVGRALPGFLLGATEHPPAVASAVARLRDGAGRWRAVAGVVLLVVLGGAAVAGLDGSAARLTVAGVSLVSSFLLVAGYVRDRLAIARVAAQVPAPRVRSALVSRRSLSELYSPVWEVAIMAVWFVAAVPVARGLMAAPGSPALLVLGLAQVAVAVGGLVFVVWYSGHGGQLPQRVRSRLGEEMGMEVDRSLRRAEMQALLASRAGILVLLGLKAAARTGAAGDASRMLDVAGWAVAAALLVVFGIYLVATARVAARAGVG
jgi:hypothetical protein